LTHTVREVIIIVSPTTPKMSKVASAKSALVARIPLACSDEAAAVAFMEEQRWNGEPACPRCGDTDVVQMKANDGTRNARFLWRCHGCKRQFTVRVGTIMEDSPIPMRHWCLAFYRACASKKGVSALQIQRETGLSYKSTLFMMHRIRWAMAPANAKEPKLRGTVEFDETYVGGVPRYPTYHRGKKRRGPPPDFADRKTPVVAGVERGGRVKARVVANVQPKTLRNHVREMVDSSATLMTDERTSYWGLGEEFEGGHHTVNHTRGEYVRGDVTTNRIDGFFAGLKRQIGGTHHSVSKKHLHRYVSEVEFKYNNRHLDDGERTVKAIQGAETKRLTYKEQTGRV
jgi:transposase-like protein